MLKLIAILTLLCANISLACYLEYYFLKSEQVEPGVYRVLKGAGFFEEPGSSTNYDTVGLSRTSDLKASLDSAIQVSSLVFIAEVDSVIENHPGNPTPLPSNLPTPTFELASEFESFSEGEFYVRLKIDTVLKGTLPSSHFWIRSWASQWSCGTSYSDFISTRFLNFSDQLDSLPDLKLSMFSNDCVNCPYAYTFDGRYLRSPDYPVLRLDITELFPDYPATSVFRRHRPAVPLRPDGRAWLPDGRRVSEDVGSGRGPVPVLR